MVNERPGRRRGQVGVRQAVVAGLGVVLLVAGCQTQKPTCPPEVYPMQYLDAVPTPIGPAGMTEEAADPEVSIEGRVMRVDRVVEGPLCHDRWRGTVYVTCGVQVMRWAEEPLFLKECDFSVEPGTIVYVAHHNDAAYYKGCSCHTGEEP